MVRGTANSAPVAPMRNVQARIDTITTTGLMSRFVAITLGWTT